MQVRQALSSLHMIAKPSGGIERCSVRKRQRRATVSNILKVRRDSPIAISDDSPKSRLHGLSPLSLELVRCRTLLCFRSNQLCLAILDVKQALTESDYTPPVLRVGSVTALVRRGSRKYHSPIDVVQGDLAGTLEL